MENLLDKLSSYNLFNYLFPGIVFVAIVDSLTAYSFTQENLVLGIFLYYFIGLIISRIGSICIEPLLKKVGFLKFSEYKDYMAASQKDQLIPVLSEANNMYRTLCSMFLCISLIKLYEHISPSYPNIVKWTPEILICLLFFLLVASYKKQTDYITKRVNKARPEE
ncbi:hypothetical protein C4C99_RS07970 [Vibrio parahaemolyticus]|nr:hypothetical protein [Vibrio parahaemolyticus]EGQ8279366.1 hypothetical protein [Vibrio parahaemolyticus]EGQ8717771.1 hypothetical protein [Vibrio parahaemolyticus]EGQ8811522.1 hypothetical protein [Vibrio parahaemolyticus]EGQ8836989.1 hypothetical protein [Vibrio parahaemolyticus]